MIQAGDIMTHVGGYHEYRGGVQYRGGTQITKDNIPNGNEYHHRTHDIPHGTQDIYIFIMISSTVLNIPTVLKICNVVLMISPQY